MRGWRCCHGCLLSTIRITQDGSLYKLRDLLELKQKAPDVDNFFKSGQFVFSATGNPFTLLEIDQAHEQNNAKVKSAGGVVGLTQDAASLHRVMSAGPEVARLIEEFRGISGNTLGSDPFCEMGAELITLDTREFVGPDTVKVLLSMEQTGREKYMEFVVTRIKSQTVSFYSPIAKSSVKIFAVKKKPLHPNRDQIRMAQLKEQNELYWRLYVASLARQLDLNKLFEYENQHSPPALSASKYLRTGNKSVLVHILESESPSEHSPSVCQGLIFDGAHLVHYVPPRPGVKTFEDYFKRQLVPHVEQSAVSVLAVRVDFVWDLYTEHSTKHQERDGRGTGIRKKDLPEKGIIPKDWADYLRNSENKTELFKYLSTRFVKEMNCFKHTVVSPTLSGHGGGGPADPRLVTHVYDMTRAGATSVMIRSTDTDVVVLAISVYHRLAALGLQELWIHFGSGKNARHLAIHKISTRLGQEKCEALPGFHAFSGCDTTSFLAGCSKRKCWTIWESHAEVTSAFKALSTPLHHLEEDIFAALVQFTVRLYDHKSDSTLLNVTRRDLFERKNHSIFTIPPTAASLRQHCLRALHQAGHLWGRALEDQPPKPPPPTDFGRKIEDGILVPVWTALPSLWAKCRELEVMCGCKKGCETKNCSCRAAKLPCCAGCKACKGKCSNSR
ncbi:Chromosome-associated kinesin KIF4 [Frankliniella fusca]|uniref:Chromosome-associated kinesin KIF4 n=1 Tax=Frankliniella fusca TaxID=407009 RepID=A0AAE1HR56_9NEOP|nr:Chromosome-associated kinesin KIF4 [Frankliniella fusca]